MARHPMCSSTLIVSIKMNVKPVSHGERTKAHWDKSPLGQKPTGQYPTGQKPTAYFGRMDKSPLLWKKIGLSLL